MKQIPILMYHWFREDDVDSTSLSPQLEIAPRLFERQMQYLQAKGYRTVSLDQALAPQERRRLPDRPIVITFEMVRVINLCDQDFQDLVESSKWRR